MTTHKPKKKMSTLTNPTHPSERSPFMDILRGLTLLGVLLSNLAWISGAVYYNWAKLSYSKGWGGEVLIGLRSFFITARGLGLFSILFGIGLCIHMSRTHGRGASFISFTLRRLGILIFFGIMHVFLFWSGDILLVYVVISILVLPLMRLKLKKLWFIASIMYAINLSIPFLTKIISPFIQIREYYLENAAWLLQNASQNYGHGSWMDATLWRLWEWSHLYFNIHLRNLFLYLTFFVLGIALWKTGMIQNSDKNYHRIRRFFHRSFWPGMGLLLLQFFFTKVIPLKFPAWPTLSNLLVRLSWPLITLGYFSGLLIIVNHDRWKKRLRVFAPLGRMTLTNYILQSAAAVWVFYGHGLGLWGRVSVSAVLAGGFIFYIFQVLWSHWWLRRFYYGPLEWLWRWMYYKKKPPFRIK